MRISSLADADQFISTLFVAAAVSVTGTPAFSQSAQEATISFDYSGSTAPISPINPVGESSSGSGSFTIPVSSNPTVNLSSLTKFNLSLTTSYNLFPGTLTPGTSSSFSYGLGDLSGLSLDVPSASLSWTTNWVFGNNLGYGPDALFVSPAYSLTGPGNARLVSFFDSQNGTVTLNRQSLFNAVITNSVHVSPGGPNSLTGQPTSMTATFTPNFGLTLQQAAQLGGYKGFNWVQTVQWPTPNLYSTFNPTQPLPPVFSDPPPGGYVGSKPYPNYSYPFYFNNNPNKQNVWSIANFINGNTLSFYDHPQNPDLPLGAKEVFSTDLVGVLPDGDPSDPLFEFTWTSNFTPVLGGYGYGGVETSSLPGQGTDDGTGGNQVISSRYFTPGVPEAPTWLMLLLGFSGLAVARRMRGLIDVRAPLGLT